MSVHLISFLPWAEAAWESTKPYFPHISIPILILFEFNTILYFFNLYLLLHHNLESIVKIIYLYHMIWLRHKFKWTALQKWIVLLLYLVLYYNEIPCRIWMKLIGWLIIIYQATSAIMHTHLDRYFSKYCSQQKTPRGQLLLEQEPLIEWNKLVSVPQSRKYEDDVQLCL